MDKEAEARLKAGQENLVRLKMRLGASEAQARRDVEREGRERRMNAETRERYFSDKGGALTEKELVVISRAIEAQIETLKKVPPTTWCDRSAVLGRMTYSAHRLLKEVERLKEAQAAPLESKGGSPT